ncbi:MAG TPA: hypothetical protein VFV75_01715 [Candidatus Polarisedimenticolaceae bacterium]|nr:hypothetical protein [Candidatus Polarisedimenticolaceae bacterium]
MTPTQPLEPWGRFQIAPRSLHDGLAAVVALAGLLALWRFQINPLLAVLVGGGIGLLRLLV